MSATSCEVVVVGGGITGAATAAHLAAAGVSSVTVLDAGPPGSGTTPAGNGTIGIWAAGFFADPRTGPGLSAGRLQAEMQRYAIDYYARLAEHQDIGYRANGTLWVSRFPTSLQEQHDRMVDHPLAPEARQVTPAEVRQLWPTVRPEAIAGGVYHPSGAQIDAGRATRALVDLGRRSGVEYRWAAQVGQILHDGARATGVLLTSGDVIRAGTVVVCVGAWTNALLEPLGRRLPLLPWLTSRVTVPYADAPAALPTLLVPDLGGLWLREDAGGYTYGNVWGSTRWDPRPAPARPDLGELASDMHGRLATPLEGVVPGLAGRPWRWIQGIHCHTPDQRTFVGPLPGIDGVLVAAGCNERGATHAPGVARALTGYVTGAADDRYAPLRVDRFASDAFPTSDSIMNAMIRTRSQLGRR